MTITRSRSRLMGRVALGAAAVLALGACGSTSTTGAAASKQQPLLGIVSIDTTDYGNKLVIEGATAAAKNLGWSVDVVNAAGSADQANAAMVNFVQRKAVAIFDLVFPTTSLVKGIAAAKAAHIPVATAGAGLADGVIATAGLGAPAAPPVTNYLVDQMGGKGQLLAFTYRVGAVCRDREQVLDSILKKYPGIKVTKQELQVPGFTTQAPQFATSWLASRPKGAANYAIWGCWDDPTLAVIPALKQNGRTDVKTYGMNGYPNAVVAVGRGDLTATTWVDYKSEGTVLVSATSDYLKNPTGWTPKTLDIPNLLLDGANFATFTKQHPGITG
ncbi:MAG: ribose transport system substrate-binding protein [Frankiales bacterium]|jgi:ribose transport system substrate-binding protein|nr:ribose transport system substrate-binding protein [Frankiales bacterium]MDX6212596.1 ribose transport system substrate-binding protein [Frankiales bacterium]